jgi:hypothetical protein
LAGGACNDDVDIAGEPQSAPVVEVGNLRLVRLDIRVVCRDGERIYIERPTTLVSGLRKSKIKTAATREET